MKTNEKEEYYHRQTSSSSSFFLRFPEDSLVGVEEIVGLVSFFGVTFSCLIVGVDFLDGVEVEVFGVDEFDFFAG